MQKPAGYVILEWLDAPPPYPRCSFATVTHVAELEPAVRWVQPCAAIDGAADLVSRLNAMNGLEIAETFCGETSLWADAPMQ